jgi:hypothetical protein
VRIEVEDVVDGALLIAATVRLTRAVTQDDIGRWLVVVPVAQWAEWDGVSEPVTVRQKVASGTVCPWCVGTWIGYLGIASLLATRWARHETGGKSIRSWRCLAAGLALNEFVGRYLTTTPAEVGT